MSTAQSNVGPLALDLEGHEERPGYRMLAALLRMGCSAVEALKCQSMPRPAADRFAGFGRLRGTGPGVSFRALAAELEHALPRTLKFPFEGSERVGGAVWSGELVRPSLPHSLAKLRWEWGADDLPMHVHESSDRCIVVLEGRGFFHVSEEGLHGFTGEGVRTIAARERDVFVFTRGVVHTFSTIDDGMTLLSCQLPFVPFDDPGQYTLPAKRWTAREYLRRADSRITLDWCWAMLGGAG